MRLKIATSIKRLILIGFFLVVLPLTIALINTIYQVDLLSRQMHRTLTDASSSVETSRLIVSQVLSLERTAGQYWVLREPETLQRYQEQLEQLFDNITIFNSNTLTPDIRNQINRLSSTEKQLYKKLLAAPKEVDAKAKIKDLPDLSTLVSDLPVEVNNYVKSKSQVMSKRIYRVKRQLLVQAIILVPLALLIATIFSVLITRPLRRLGHSINKLGSGDFTNPVNVKGPQDIEQLGVRLNWLRLQLAEIEEQKLTFLQHVSHELKTPLTAIREGVALLQDKITGPLTPDQVEIVDILRSNELQLQKEVEALLDFNLALSQEKPDHTELIELGQLIQEVINNRQLEIMSRSVTMETHFENIHLKANTTQLTTVVDNLLSNAIKYSPKSSEIVISLNKNNDHAQLDVIDNGPGIEEEDKNRIFDPFYQGNNTQHTSVAGTGLGLAIANRYVLLHHGSIKVINSTSGAHFRVYLPLHT